MTASCKVQIVEIIYQDSLHVSHKQQQYLSGSFEHTLVGPISHAYTFFRRHRPGRSYKSPTPLVSLILGPRLLTDPIQHHAKACGATYHARIRLWGLIQRHCFDHRADVLKDTELEGVFLV